MAYIGQEPGQGQAERFIFTASGSETVVSTADDGRVIGYTAGQVSVYLNGVKLVVGTDCIATNGSTITGLSALSASDVVEVIALSAFSPSDTVSASGGTFTGAVTASAGVVGNLTGNASGTAATVTTAAQPAITSVGTLTALTGGTGDLNWDSNTLVVDSSASNVGIGTATPSRLLTLSNLAAAGDTLLSLVSATDGTCQLLLGDSGSDTRGRVVYNNSNDSMILRTAGAEQLTIASDGKLFTLPTYNNTSAGGANVYILSTGELHRSTSSRRYKTNIVDSAKGLTELLTLRPVDFNSLCTHDDLNKLKTGFIAEEVDELGFEEYVVRDEENEVQSVEYGHMTALCVKAIQELSAKNDALEARILTLESA